MKIFVSTMFKVVITLFFINSCAMIQSAKILAVFPMPSISHQVVFRPITQELARRGHEVTVITPDPAFPNGDAPANLKEIDVHDISYHKWQTLFRDNFKQHGNNDNMTFSNLRQGLLMLMSIFEAQLQSPEVQNLINNTNNRFDIILLEAFIRPALVFSHIFKAPVILISSLGAFFHTYTIMGALTHPLLYPTPIHKRVYNLTLREKFNEIYDHYSFQYALYLNEDDENKRLQQILGPSIPSYNELYKNIDMLFLNIHPIWANNQPIPPSILYIGGIHQKAEKPLPKDLQVYLDSSKHGVIYLSFGTNVLADMIPPNSVKIIFDVLSKLPYEVLWKWDKDALPGHSENIRMSKWFPQSDLLRHPKIKLFITQAGLQSTDEAVNAGVPLVAIPMLGDQWYNAEQFVKSGIGKKLEIETLSADEFRKTIEDVIEDDRYRKNVIKLREIIRDEPEPPLQRAVWWVEYVIRHGGAKHLRPPSANISYAQYFEIEVLFIVVLVFLLILATIILFTVVIARIVFRMFRLKLNVKLD